MRRILRALATIVVTIHAAFLLLMAFAWVLPLKWHLSLIAFVLLPMPLFGGDCWLTRLEFAMKRRYLRKVRPESMTRRLIRWLIHADISEAAATRAAALVIVYTLFARLFK